MVTEESILNACLGVTQTFVSSSANYGNSFKLSGSIWNKYIFKTIVLDGQQSYIDCAVYCELDENLCELFVISGNNGYLGNYSHTGSLSDLSDEATVFAKGIA